MHNGIRINSWGHLNRMEGVRLVKKITDWNTTGLRTKGRPKNRWRDEVTNDLKKLKLRNFSQDFKSRKAWNNLEQKTKTLWVYIVRRRRRRRRRRTLPVFALPAAYFDNELPNRTKSHPRRQQPSYSPPREPKVSDLDPSRLRA
jgi:hypothetical protein